MDEKIKYVLRWFIVSRFLLTVIGVLSRSIIKPANYVWVYSKYLFLDIWGVWDSGWYLDIARNWYTTTPMIGQQANYAFFPLYPLCMRLLGFMMDEFIAGIIISNIFLILSAYYIYKLTENKKSVDFFFLMPTAFILSGVFSESLYLFLVIFLFYSIKKKRWSFVGIFGFLASLTRPLGVFIFLPAAYEYLNQKKNKVDKEVFWLGMIPLGLILFMIYNYFLTKDFLAFVHIYPAWNRTLVNPVFELFSGLYIGIYERIWSFTFIIAMSILWYFRKKISISYFIYSSYSLILPLCFGLEGMLRYVTVLFPISIIFSKLSKDNTNKIILYSILIIVQSILMVYWSIGSAILA